MPDASIIELLRESSSPLLSYEFFPPKDDKGRERLQQNAARLLPSAPNFVTVTWGAGGTTREKSLEICDMLRQAGLAPVMPHLTCVGAARAELAEIIDEIYDRGFRNIMALRGDPPAGEKEFRPPKDGFAHANELVQLIKERHDDICVGVAGYPETHPESAAVGDDVAHLKTKIQAGADFITSQLFFDNRFYFDFVDVCRSVGIRVPILAGLLPAMSLKQVQRFMTMCGASFPPELSLGMRRAGARGPGAEEVGIEWAATQIKELLARGAPGIHLYMLNRSKAAMAPAVTQCFESVRNPA